MTEYDKRNTMSMARAAYWAFFLVAIIFVSIGLVAIGPGGGSTVASTPTPTPTPTPRTFSGVGHRSLGTITVPSGGAVMTWECPTCDGIIGVGTVLQLWGHNENADSLGTLSMLSAWQDHPTYGANNNVRPGIYRHVTADAEAPADITWKLVGQPWTFTITPNVVGEVVKVTR